MPIHIMHLVRPANGGIREHVRQLISGMSTANFRISVVCPADSPLLEQLPAWVEMIELPLADGLRPASDLQSIQQVRKLLANRQVDILHMHGAKAALIGRAACILPSGKNCPRHRPKLVYTSHNFVEPDNPLLRHAVRTAENRLSSYTDRYIAVSQALSEQLQAGYSLPPSKVVTVHNGLPAVPDIQPKQAARAFFAVPEDALVLGTAARLHPEKGVADLLIAMRHLRGMGLDPWLVVVGDGPEKQHLQHAFTELADRIRWMGEVERAARYFLAFDVYVQSSRREGFGLAVLEAMQVGIPVVATRTGGLAEVVGEAGAHCLVPPAQPKQLAAKIHELLMDQQYNSLWAVAGQHRAQAHFSADRMVASTINIYEEMMAEGGTLK